MAVFLEFPSGSSNIASPVATVGDLPAQGTIDGQLIVVTSTDTLYVWNQPTLTWLVVTGGGGGSGDVNGPASSVNNQMVQFNGVTGKAIKAFTGTGVVKSASGVVTASAVDLTSEVTAVLPVANGGTNSSAALTGNKAVVSNGTAIVESATTSTEIGYVSGVTSSIQTQLNAKALAARLINTTAPLTGGGDLSADRTLSMPAATNSVDGYLTAADHTTFAAKVSATRAINTTSPLTGGGNLSADRTLAINQATSVADGYLSSTDFNTFNGKQPAGNYITALSGDVVATGPGAVTATIQPGAVTNAKIAALAGISVNKLAALTVSSPVRSDASGFLTTGNLNAATELTGVVPVANGGTNSSASLSNNRVIQSFGGAIVEAAAITGNRALASDVNGIPTHTAVTDTELGYVSGVTSAIQTQIANKVSKAGDTMTGQLTLAADPAAPLQAATKQYVDSVAAGLDVKASTLVASTGNLTLSGEQTIDGVLTSTSRVLVKNQSSTFENGIYVTASGAWTRSSDMDSWAEVPGAFVFVEQGTLYADTAWVCTADAGGTLNTTPITWSQFAGAGTNTTDGQGLLYTGNQLSLVLENATLFKSASGLKVATGGINNNEVNAAAAIARSKLASGTANRLVSNDGSGVMSDLAAITANRALASDTNGLPVASTTTDTELGFVAGVTSAIQTQLNGKQATGNYITALSGDVVATGPGAVSATIQAGAVTNAKIAAAAGISLNKLAAVTANRAVVSDVSGFLTASTASDVEVGYLTGVTSAIQTQLDAKLSPTQVLTISSNVTLTDRAIHLVDTSAARSLTLPSPTTGRYIVVKDKTGSANSNNITIVRFAAEQIEGAAASYVLDYNRGSWVFVSDGTDWFVI